MTDNRKKILFVHHGSGMGGAPQLLLKFLVRLDLEKYNQNACPFLHISDGFYGIRHPHLILKMSWGQIKSYRAAKKILNTEKPDIISVCAGYTGFRKSLLIKKSLKWGDKFVFMLKSEAEKWGVADASNITVVYDFIETEKFRNISANNELREKYSINKNTFLIGYLGRFTKAKGVHHLLRAAGMLKQKGMKAKLSGYLGKKPYIEQLKKIIKDENLENNVTFTGEMTDVASSMLLPHRLPSRISHGSAEKQQQQEK